MEDLKVTTVVLVDFSNVFTTVRHNLLLAIITRFSVSRETLDWF